MKKLLLAFGIIGSALLAYQFSYQLTYSNTGAAPPGYSGSPADGKTCGTNGGCHGGGATAMANLITSDIPAGGYIPGETYSISASISAAGINKFGFILSPQDASGNTLGTLMSTSATQLLSGGKYITHVASSTSGSGSKTWTFDWVAPAVGTGDVDFYAAFNAANGNNSTSGDQIFTGTLTVSEDPSVSVGKVVRPEPEISIFPNPTVDVVNLKLEDPELNEVTVGLFDLQGRQVASLANGQEIQGTFQTTYSTSELNTKGTYIMLISTNLGDYAKKVVVN